jgi:hypothetical protein
MSRGKYALDPELAGASKILGPALIYRNGRLRMDSFPQTF